MPEQIAVKKTGSVWRFLNALNDELMYLSMFTLVIIAINCSPATAATDPEHKVLSKSNGLVKMREGTKPADDIHRPDAQVKFLTILVRTPYNKKTPLQPCQDFFPQRGYVVVIQDVRGRFTSGGVSREYLSSKTSVVESQGSTP